MNDETIHTVLTILQDEVRKFNVPIVTLVAERTRDPFRVLVSTMLSLRTKDDVTTVASRKLFGEATTPDAMLRLSEARIRKLIYPVGFYKTKARNIRETCRILLDEYGGSVPDDIERLVRLPGVGRKTANLVVTLGFGKPGICVDTHVHRITNRFGYVTTKTPDETETVLRAKLPPEWWIPINDILVAYGQGLCTPVSPWCSRCRVAEYCGRVGVKRSR